MAGTIPKVIDDGLLKCKLCINPFKDPKILPCLHIFCKACLSKYAGSLPRQRQKSAALDPQALEEALGSAACSLDQEIPVHGYDDVVGGYPSLPKMQRSNRSSKQSQRQQSHIEGEYSEVAPPEDAESEPGNSPRGGVYTLEKALSPNITPYLPMNKTGERSKSDPIDERKVNQQLQGQSQSARSSKVEVGGKKGSGVERTNTYLPMDRGSPRNSQKDLDKKPVTDTTVVGTLNKTYEVMGNTNSSRGDTEKQATASAVNLSVPLDKPLSLNTASSPDSYDVTNQSMQLTGFGLASPVPMSLFRNNNNKHPVKPESIYQAEKTGITRATSNAETVRGGVGGSGLSKRTSQSVDMLSTAIISGDKQLTKQSSEGDLKGLQLSLMTHSLSAGNMLIEEEPPVTSSTSDQAIPTSDQTTPKGGDSLGERLTYSPTSGHDGYETPLPQRTASNELSPSPTVGSPPMLQTVRGTAVPPLPPKQSRSGSDRRSMGGDSLHAIEMAPPPPVPRTGQSSHERRLAVGETLSPTRSDPDSAPDNWRDSVFVEHIYEEIQYTTAGRGGGRRGARGSKANANVPMMRPLRGGSGKSGGHKGSTKSLKKKSISSVQDEFNPRQRKAKSVLKKSKQHEAPRHASSDGKDTRVGGLQVGNKLMRKSSVLLDESGFPYISDHFDKVTIHHNNEDIELIYSEVSDLAQQRQPASPIYTSEKSTRPDSSSLEMACPTCQSVFQLLGGDVENLPSCNFIENLREARDLENTLRPSCKNCKERAEYKCLECDKYLCKRCNDTHKWFKVVQGHQVMSLTELQSGKFTSQIMDKKQEVCPNHCHEPPHFYCDTCSQAVCRECAACYHRSHPCLPLSEVAERGTSLLSNFPSMTNHVLQSFRAENLQLDKYRLQYQHEKKLVASEVIGQYVKAARLLEESYQELLRHVEHRYNEEVMYVDEIQKRNKQLLTRVEQSNKLAEHVSEFGNDCDVIHMTKLLMQNLLAMETCQPIKLENKMEVQFNPLSSVRAIDVLPLIGQASREYKPIKRLENLDPSSIDNDWNVSNTPVRHLHTFMPKTDSDKKGCKPTGIALTRDDNIVLVDDINRKIKIFTEEGQLVHEIVPTNREELVDPWDVTVTNYGNFAVTDRGSKQVKIFDPDGDLVCEFGPHLANPWGVCCNKNGDLIVTDTDHRCVFVHDSNGNLKFKVNAPAKLAKFPEYVTTNSMGDIIVSDLKAHCVYVFNLLGQFLFKVGPKDSAHPKVKVFHSPCGIYTDAEDNILVADYEMVRVSKFNRNGRFVSHFLTFMDSLQAPQSLIINRKGHVVLSDGNFIKTFSMEQQQEVDLELKPKVYNRKLSKQDVDNKKVAAPPPCPPRISHPREGAAEGAGKGENKDFSESEESSNQSSSGSMVVHPAPQTPDKASERLSRSSRSSSAPRHLGNSDNINSLSYYGSPANLMRAIQDYDTPRVSVKKIKERLTSIDRSQSHREGRDEGGNGRGNPNPVIRNPETSKVSIDKVKEKLLRKDSNASSNTGVVGPKPKLQPKPSFKQIADHMKASETKKTVPEGPIKVVHDQAGESPVLRDKTESVAYDTPIHVSLRDETKSSAYDTPIHVSPRHKIESSAYDTPIRVNPRDEQKELKDRPSVEASKTNIKDSNSGTQKSKVQDTESKVKDTELGVKVKVSKVSNEGTTVGQDLEEKDKEASAVIKPKEPVKKAGEFKMSPLRVPDKKKSPKTSPSISQKEQKSKKSPKLFRTARKLTNKGTSSDC